MLQHRVPACFRISSSEGRRFDPIDNRPLEAVDI